MSRLKWIPAGALAVVLLAPAVVFSAGTGGGPTPSTPRTPADRSKSLYNSGVKLVKRGDAALAKGNDADLERARVAYGDAVAKFTEAVQLSPNLHEAWNYLGYSYRQLGDAASALAAYDRALQLKPDFPEAIEYRGVAYLSVGNLTGSKDAYLVLFQGNRKLADELLAAMRAWIVAQRATPGAVAPERVDELAAWVDEREAIAASTASLTREGADAAWR
jgi:tetratricopeptide (TPR) repeat protein